MGQAGGPQAACPAGRSAAAPLAAQSRNGRRDADAHHHRAAAESELVPGRAGPWHQADASVTLGMGQEEPRDDHGTEHFLADRERRTRPPGVLSSRDQVRADIQVKADMMTPARTRPTIEYLKA